MFLTLHKISANRRDLKICRMYCGSRKTQQISFQRINTQGCEQQVLRDQNQLVTEVESISSAEEEFLITRKGLPSHTVHP